MHIGSVGLIPGPMLSGADKKVLAKCQDGEAWGSPPEHDWHTTLVRECRELPWKGCESWKEAPATYGDQC